MMLILTPNSGWSWGPLGHRVAAAMAQERLTPAATAAVRDIFGKKIRLADISTWADEQQEIPESRAWHFVNVPIQAARYDPKYCPPEGCVVSKIKEFKRILQDPRTDKRLKQEAVKFLIHLIADLHQPLHVGDNGDKGGNLLQVRFFGIGSNLHKVWDSQVIERHTKYENVWLWDMDFIANPGKVKEWSKGTPEDWATETLQVAKAAYRLPGTGRVMKSGVKLGNEYNSFALPIIQVQLAKAGIRTAFVLNEIFK